MKINVDNVNVPKFILGIYHKNLKTVKRLIISHNRSIVFLNFFSIIELRQYLL